jgi:hypothetical protein
MSPFYSTVNNGMTYINGSRYYFKYTGIYNIVIQAKLIQGNNPNAIEVYLFLFDGVDNTTNWIQITAATYPAGVLSPIYYWYQGNLNINIRVKNLGAYFYLKTANTSVQISADGYSSYQSTAYTGPTKVTVTKIG